MRLRNKKTGEIVVFGEGIVDLRQIGCNNVAEMMDAGWEDYKEPKKYYYITSCGEITHRGYQLWKNESVYDKKRKQFGNYFETEEEAEKAVEKLKALKRLRDKGLKFVGWEDTNNDVNDILFELPYMEWDKNVCDDLDLLFGGEK